MRLEIIMRLLNRPAIFSGVLEKCITYLCVI